MSSDFYCFSERGWSQHFIYADPESNVMQGDPRIHPEPGAGRPALGPDGSMALSGHRHCGSKPSGAALATPHSRFERLTQ